MTEYRSATGVVLVFGPQFAGATSVLNALRERLPDYSFVERCQLGPDQVPVAVVFVVTAAAHLVHSDCELLDGAVKGTDAVIAVISKIDVHRSWRDVLDANRAILAGHRGRYRATPWVGAAAAPDLSRPVLDDLVDAVRSELVAVSLTRRNELRISASGLTARLDQLNRDVDGHAVAVDGLRQQRSAVMRNGRQAKTDQANALRNRVQEARIELTAQARQRCASARTELQRRGGEVTRRTVARFGDDTRKHIQAVFDEISAVVGRRLAELDVERTEIPAESILLPPMPQSRQLEGRLMTLMGLAFGLSVTVTLSRTFGDVQGPAGLVGALIIGVGLATWMVGARSLLQRRAALERWVGEVAMTLSAVVEAYVARQMAAAEYALTDAAVQRDAVDCLRVDERVSALDRAIRTRMLGLARVTAYRDREKVMIENELAAVRTEFARIRVVRLSDPT